MNCSNCDAAMRQGPNGDWACGNCGGTGVVPAARETRVAAVGLPLGMVEDPAIAAAAQQLMDACLEDKGDEVITEAVRSLRAAFYPEAAA